MTRRTVSWIQRAEVVAIVDVGVDELVEWAADNGQVRALIGADAGTADAGQVRRLLQTNDHIHNALIRLWALSRTHETAESAG